MGFYFGNLEPFRLPAAREFGYEFEPPMDHLRNDPYDNQTGGGIQGQKVLHKRNTARNMR